MRRRHFGGEAVGIGFVDLFAVGHLHVIFVKRAFAQAGNEQFPDSAGNMFTHWMTADIPGIEIANQADALCVGSPNGEIHTFHAVDRTQMGAEFVVALPVLALAQQVADRIRRAAEETRKDRAWLIVGLFGRLSATDIRWQG